MPEASLFLLFVRPLNRARIHYAATGSFAAIFYGESSLTHGLDFVVFLNPPDIHQVFPMSAFYLPPADVTAL